MSHVLYTCVAHLSPIIFTSVTHSLYIRYSSDTNLKHLVSPSVIHPSRTLYNSAICVRRLHYIPLCHIAFKPIIESTSLKHFIYLLRIHFTSISHPLLLFHSRNTLPTTPVISPFHIRYTPWVTHDVKICSEHPLYIPVYTLATRPLYTPVIRPPEVQWRCPRHMHSNSSSNWLKRR